MFYLIVSSFESFAISSGSPDNVTAFYIMIYYVTMATVYTCTSSKLHHSIIYIYIYVSSAGIQRFM